MKKLFLILFLCCLPVSAQESYRVVNPDENTKVEIILDKDAREFKGNVEIINGAPCFDLILCNEKGLELKRTKTDSLGQYNFGALSKGRYFLKFDNVIKQTQPKKDKAAPYIMDLPYVKKKARG